MSRLAQSSAVVASMSIQALSEAIAHGRADMALFQDDQPENLAALVQRMEHQGYKVSAPVEAPHLAPNWVKKARAALQAPSQGEQS